MTQMNETTATAIARSEFTSPSLPTLDFDAGAFDPLVLLTPAVVAAAVPADEAVDCGSDSGTGCSVGVRIEAEAVEAAEAAAGKGATAVVVAAAATVVLPGPDGETALTALTGPEGPEDMSRPGPL